MSLPRGRTVVPIFGLPFDVVTLEEAISRISEAVRSRQRLFLSTPNLNFAISAMTDVELRQSVLSSDLSVADGMPLVWASRILGCPLPERVSGSDLFARLSARTYDLPIKVYFFGGEPGAAQQACQLLNARKTGTHCVGFSTPGFGSVEDMSAPQYIDAINASDADMLIVAVSARKGQAWIMRNLSRLRPPVVTYLGAVINFESGRIRRSPSWMSRLGLEWAWRISQEPKLWRRYAIDARALLALLFQQVIPIAFRRILATQPPARPDPITTEINDEEWIATPSGVFDAALGSELMRALHSSSDDLHPVLDLRTVTSVNSEGIASCMVCHGIALRRGRNLLIQNASQRVRREFSNQGAGYLLQLSREKT